ncbi:hypothetical protein [Archangium sp.]|uniref:hypothetical protein n=1 Tax=Archangium sp. TaxID=1872627 RepID=UPI00286D3D1F|nr:hypothetical protein [Archangium sp.]
MVGLASIPRRTLLVVAVISGVLTLVLALKLRAIDQHLKPYSIVEYEFAWSAECATKMFMKWDKDGMEAARDSLRYDFPFLLAYSPFVSALVLLAARTRKLTALGAGLTVAPFAAAFLDVLENVALCRVLDLSQAPPERLLQFAALMAGVKFLLLIASVLYVLFVGLPALVTRLRARG